MRGLLLVVAAAAAVVAWVIPAQASVGVGRNTHDAALKVGPGGVAEVSWRTATGNRRYALVLKSGKVRWGRRLTARDVSRPAAVDVPFPVTVRRTSDGRLWALQEWQRLRGGDRELHFSRWRGAPTKLTLRSKCCKRRSERILGTATFQGRPIHGFNATRKGVPLDEFGRNVYVDSLQSGAWKRIVGVLTRRPNGWYRVWIRPHWRGQQYRGTIRGPNFGWTLAPDARAVTSSSL